MSTTSKCNEVRGATGAIRSVVQQARARTVVGRGSFLLVQGTPLGANVEIDHGRIETLPWSGRVEPGPHHVRVYADGYVAIEEDADVPADVDAIVSVDVDLLPVGSEGEADVLNWILGASFAAAGVALVVPALVNAGLDGGCATPNGVVPTRCSELYAFDGARDGALLAIGGALLVTGIVFLAVQSFRVNATVSTTHARLQLEGTF